MREKMTTVPLAGHAPSSYGLGIYVYRDLWGGGTAYTHDGRDPGYEADMLHFPDLGLTIALCANGSGRGASRIYSRLVSDVVRLSVAAVDLTAPPSPNRLRDGSPTRAISGLP